MVRNRHGRSTARAPLAFARLQVIAGALILGLLIAPGASLSQFAYFVPDAIEPPPPAAPVIEAEVVEPPRPVVIRGPSLAHPAVYDEPAGPMPPPRTTSSVYVRMGPSQHYVVVGVLPAGSRLKVVGRDETGEWLSVAFPPNSSYSAWLPLADVKGMKNVESLDVAPVRLLP
jgi:hypothetical protein